MRLAFAGTPAFAESALRALLGAGHEVALVLTQPDRPAGRGLRPRPSAVKALAQEHGLPLAQPATLKSNQVLEDLRAAQARVMVVAAYGLILPPSLLELFDFGCINIHASLLPRWRGAAPIQRAILAGDSETGISIMHMEAGLDTGPVYLRQSVRIERDDTAGSLHDKLAVLGGSCIVRVLAALEGGQIHADPQSDQGVSYANKIEKREAMIDWSRAASADRAPNPSIQSVSRSQHKLAWRAAAGLASECGRREWRYARPHRGHGQRNLGWLRKRRAVDPRVAAGRWQANAGRRVLARGCACTRGDPGQVIDTQLRAVRVVLHVLAGRSLASELPRMRNAIQDDSGGALQDICFGVFRHLGLLRSLLAALATRALKDRDVAALLLVALYQLQFTQAAPHAVVDHAVRACTRLRKASAKGLVNALLRNFLRHPEALLSQARRTEEGRWSYPQWWIDEVRRAYPGRHGAILEAGITRPPMTLRVNLRLIRCEDYLALLHGAGIGAEQVGRSALAAGQAHARGSTTRL